MVEMTSGDGGGEAVLLPRWRRCREIPACAGCAPLLPHCPWGARGGARWYPDENSARPVLPELASINLAWNPLVLAHLDCAGLL